MILFDLSNLYITTEVVQPERHGYEGAWCKTHFCKGPRGDVYVGMVVEVSDGVVLNYGVKHESFIEEGDRGFESGFVSLTWRPIK